jgi:glycosyltransferase involved in cell wall biosynthesis
VWSRRSYRAIQQRIAEVQPDVAHFHNTLPLISPSAYYAAKRSGVPVVQTLHNYRLLCPAALLLRDGRACHACVGRKVALPAIQHRCYRGSAGASAAVVGMLAMHRARGTFDRMIDQYIALTEFARAQFVAGGLPAERIVTKPNFLAEDPGPGTQRRSGLLFVGRLVAEKGIGILLQAAQGLTGQQHLTIVGEGPLRSEVDAVARSHAHVTYLGERSREQVLRLMQSSKALVFPSQWYEGFPMTMVEAFACGLPVVASNLGSMAAIVEHERNGLLVASGDVLAWIEAMTRGSEAPDNWGVEARQDFLARYSAAANVSQLLAIYDSATGRSRLASSIKRERQPVGFA